MVIYNFGTWIILPKDKIIEGNLDENTLIYQLINVIANTVQGVIPKKPNTSTYRPSKHFFTKSMQKRGKAYIGWSEISAIYEYNDDDKISGLRVLLIATHLDE